MLKKYNLPVQNIKEGDLISMKWDLFIDKGWIPLTDEIEQTWGDILNKNTCNMQCHIDEVIKDVLGKVTEDIAGLWSDVNHLAFYIGDYSENSQVYEFASCLKKKKDKREIVDFDYGASHLAVKYHGTQGWWFSVNVDNNIKLELFTFLRFGDWAEINLNMKSKHISHFAINVSSKENLDEIINKCKDPNIEIISYVIDDEIGHTYAHFRNINSSELIEFVFEQ